MSVASTKVGQLTYIGNVYIYWILSFCIPLFLSSPQIITGTLINCFFFLAVDRVSKKEIIPLIILPSLGALSHGILFGPQTAFLLYFLPFIWLGNFTLVWVFSKTKSQPYILRVIVSSLLKYLFLQGFAYIYFYAKIVPQLFVSSMGYIQFFTAIGGGFIAYCITKYLVYERKRNTH